MQTNSNQPAPAWFPKINPTAAELAHIEANDVPALEADCRQWHRFAHEFMSSYHAEQAERFGADLRVSPAELVSMSYAELVEVEAALGEIEGLAVAA